jgi:hypothetical protein
MRVILIHQSRGLTRTFVIKGWLQGLLSLCLLAAPVALGCLGYQLSIQHNEQAYAQQSQVKGEAAALEELALLKIGAQAPDVWPPDLPPSIWQLPKLRHPGLRAGAIPALPGYRHGRVIDPATYQHHRLG